jgi:hypothetical protein
MTDTKHLYASPEASQLAVAQPVQEELLGDAGGSTPVCGQLSYFSFRRQIAIAIRRTNGFTDAQVAGDYTRPSQGASEKPLRCPPSEATTRHQAVDHFGVWLVTQCG